MTTPSTPLDQDDAAALASQLSAHRLSLAQLHTILSVYAARNPAHHMLEAEALRQVIQEALSPPPMRFECDEENNPYLVNPRTGQPDNLQSVDQATRWTTMEPIERYNIPARRLCFYYDGYADFDALCYVSESDGLPVSLPEGWHEA